VGIIPDVPKFAKWTCLGQAYDKGWFGSLIVTFIIMCILTLIGAAAMKRDVKRYVPGFAAIYFPAFVGIVVANQNGIN